MAILVSNNDGWFICSRLFFNSLYRNCVEEEFNENLPNTLKLIVKEDFYRITTPFVMNSSALNTSQKLKNKSLLIKTTKRDLKKEKKLLSYSLSQEEKLLKENALKIVQETKNKHFLNSTEINSEDWFHNNCFAREAAKEVFMHGPNEDIPSKYFNEANLAVVQKFGNEKYIIPPLSTFHLSDISHVEHINDKFDLILLDPPWENKSVRRNKKYARLSCDSLTDLPIEKLCNPGCLIVMWLTNNENQMSFVRDKLFPKWKVISPVIWYWMKVTVKGHFVHPMEWHHKKPYEKLFLGFVDHKPPSVQALEPFKVIVSVPSSIHSHKPPLTEILKPYFPEHPKCLELFARYLLPGWTSLGNEVLKLQNKRLFEEVS